MGIKAEKIYTVGSEWMKRRCDFIQVIEEGIKICIDGRKMIITNPLEEMICKEIWLGEDYNINLQEKSVVIDIGMNVGYATLFFANKPFVKKEYGFEPDQRVYVEAEKNIKLNSDIEDKVKTFNVACSDCHKEEEYVINERESAGIYKIRDKVTSENAQKEIVKCVDSAEVIGNIIEKHFTKNKIVMKCDCEGAEYEILNRLEEVEYLKKIDAFVMEWHLGRREEIEALFERNNYTYYIFTTPGRSFGKCYAFRCR